MRLLGASGELVGVLCLGDREQPVPEDDNQVLQAIAGHAAVALENARLFTRMDQANRHWVEIFDAISDFIVAHDEAGNVLRVNRSLADFIGVQPQALIGVNMSRPAGHGRRPAAALLPLLPQQHAKGTTSMFIPCWNALTWFPLRAFTAPAARACRPSTC